MEMKRIRWQYGSNAVGMVVAVLAVLVLAYGVLQRHPWRWDVTANKEESLSPQTEKVLADLKEPVTINAFFRRGDDIDEVYIRRKVDDLLQGYARHSRLVTYRMFDPDLNVPEALQYNITTDGTIVFSSGKNRKDVLRSQLFDYSQTPEASMPAFLGEGHFTNTILAVTQTGQKTIYFLQGHGERGLEGKDPVRFSEIKQFLERENYQVRPLSFITSAQIPNDASVLVIAGPTKVVSPQEDQLIADYLQKGTLLLLLDPLTNPGLELTLKELGVKPQHDLVLDPGRHFLLGPQYPAPQLETHPITKDLLSMNPILSMAQSLSFTADRTDITRILTSSPDAWGETNLAAGSEAKNDKGVDHQGPLTLGVVLQKERPVAVVVGDSDFATNGFIQVPGNSELLLNMVSWLIGDEAKLEIGPRKTVFRSMMATPLQGKVIAYLTQLGYPLVVLVIGLVYWYRRKNR